MSMTAKLATLCAEKRQLPYVQRHGNRCTGCGSTLRIYGYIDVNNGIHIGHPEGRDDKHKASLGPSPVAVCRECMVEHLAESWPDCSVLRNE